MADEALQVAFEIKIVCDELSRKLLRWHWEQTPGTHSLDAMLRYVAQRQKESPDYYDRMPDLGAKTSWQQLDTTICMRILLDPEKDAAKPMDLLGNAARPAAARRACNAVRMARNQAAHATDHMDGVQAAILFNEAIESLEDGYAGTVMKETELAKYYRQAEEFLQRCGAKESDSLPQKDAKPKQPAKNKKQPQKQTKSSSSNRTSARKTEISRSTSAGKNKTNKTKKRKKESNEVLWLLAGVLILGLLVRAYSMGLI